MKADRLYELFCELVQIDSPSRHEAAFAARCKQELEALGFSVCFDNSAEQTGSEIGNLLAQRPGTLPGAIVLSSHLDTVEPGRGIVPVLGDDGIIRSQGNTILASDDKSGIAAIFEALRSLIETGESLPTVFVLLSTCEELSLLGSGAFDVNALPQGAPLYVFDADGAPGTIITKAPSHYTFEACFTGKSAHAGVEPEAGISAIRMAANAIANMPLGRLDECTTANVGLIDGGREVNIVPETCTIKGECRSFYEERLVPVRAALEDACVQAAAQAGGSVNVSWRVDYKAVLYKEDHPVVQAVVRAAERAGLTPRIAQSGGGADANKYASQGIPAITLGTGMTNFHTTQEHIALADLEGLTRLIEELLRDPLEVVQ